MTNQTPLLYQLFLQIFQLWLGKSVFTFAYSYMFSSSKALQTEKDEFYRSNFYLSAGSPISNPHMH